MADFTTKLAVKTEEKAGEPVSALQAWRPVESLFREVDRLFQGFDRDFLHSPFRRSVLDIEPFWRRQLIWGAVPAVDIVEKDNAYEVTAELPGLDEKNVEVKLANGGLRSKAISGKRKRRKRRITISTNVTSVPSSGASVCPKALIPTKSRRTLTRGCSR